MNRDEAKQYVKGQLDDYLLRKGLRIDKNFACLSPTHNEKTPSMSFNKKNHYVHCFGCGRTYDIFSLIAIDYNCDNKEAFKIAYELYNVEIDDDKSSSRKKYKPRFSLSSEDIELIGFKHPGWMPVQKNLGVTDNQKVSTYDLMTDAEMKNVAKEMVMLAGRKCKAVKMFTEKKQIQPLHDIVSTIYNKEKELNEKAK